MRAALIALLLFASFPAVCQTKRAAIWFDKPMKVKWFVGPNESEPLELSVRGLWVAGKLREFTTGEPHDVTDHLFVIRRAYRLNDRLPDDEKKIPQWRWARGGWLLVNRLTGSVTHLRLPEFEPYYSSAAWYRDYVAYCGISDDAERVYAVVFQIGQKKPLLHRSLGRAFARPMPDTECATPQWQRQPARVTFQRENLPPLTFEVRGSRAEFVEEEQPETPEAPPAPSADREEQE
jgi:hypothetical protein